MVLSRETLLYASDLKGHPMFVKKVDVFPLEYQEPNDDYATRYIVLVRLETDTGVVGWGEAITQFRESTAATVAILQHGLIDVVLNHNV